MKYKILAAVLSSVMSACAVSAEARSEAMATWQAVAKKDTTSKLVVTPLGSLSFQYAEGIEGFNKQKGLFDVAISGDAKSTAFKLTSRLVSNTLTQLDKSGSTLTVGVNYYNDELTEGTDTVMIDTANGKLGGNLSPLSIGFKEAGRVTAQDAFTFSIIGGTSDGTKPIVDYSTLPEGIWSGDVSVRFDAVWSS